MTHPVRGHIRAGSPVRPHIRSNPGGSGKGGAGTAAVAVGLAVVMGAGPGGVPPATAPTPSPSIQLKAQAKVKQLEKRLPQLKLRWQRKGYQVNARAEPAFDCAAHSYGKVRDFFVSHHCTFMIRTYGAFRDKQGDAILVAFSWVEMPTQSEAARLKTLVDTGGTGNVTELSRDTWRYRNVKFAGLGYDSDIEGRAVWNVQVQPVARRTRNVLLNEIRKDVLEAAIESIQS